ncbi:hypothetical protein [Dysgonomonas sp.]
MKKNILLILMIMIINSGVQSQSSGSAGNLDFPSLSSIQPIEPTSTSLGKYGEYSMNYSKGLPNISIPLYEIKSGDLTIPLTLNYQGGGIKVSQEATWVGLGWDLSYGGQITRVVNGFPDEVEPAPDQRPTATNVNNYILQNNVNIYDGYLALLSSGTFNYSFAPDEYFYSIGTESGKYIGENVEIIIPYQPIKIISNQIINARGDVFSFIDGDITKTRDTGHTFPEYISAWYLDKVESINKHVIRYTYQPDGVFVNDKDLGYYESYFVKTFKGAVTSKTHSPMKPAGMPLTVTSRKPEYIYFDGGRIHFELSSREDISLKKLSNISIEYLDVNNNYILLKTILFDYSYKDNRLMLNRVIEKANDGSTKLIGEFEYNQTTLPAKDSFNYDYSGYSNGHVNTTPIPSQKFIDFNGVEIAIGGANKDAGEYYAQGSILTTVKYPTGGKTVFTWENHKYNLGHPINSWDIMAYENNLYDIFTYSIETCTTDEENIPHMVTPELGCSSSYFEFVCKETQSTSIEGRILATSNDDPLHVKYDRCILKILDKTTNTEVFIFDRKTTTTLQRLTKSVNLEKGHTYSCYAMTNCFNAAGDITFKVKSKRAVPPPINFSYFGLRIKEITNYSNNTEISSRKVFSYMQPSDTVKSSGYLANWDDPRWILENKTLKGVFINKGCEREETINTFFYDKPLAGLTPDNIYYEYVQVKDISSDGNNGITKYQFQKSYDMSFGIQVPLISKSSDRGQLLNEQIYDNKNNKIEETTYFYGIDSRINKASKGFKLLSPWRLDDGCKPILDVNIYLSDMYIPVDYSYNMNWLRQDSVVRCEYRNLSNPIKTSTIFTYDDIKSCLPTKISVTTSINPQKSIVVTQYPSQLSDPVSLAMMEKNFISQYITKEKFIDSKLLTKQTNKYSLGSGTTAGLFLLDSILVQNDAMPGEKEINVSKYSDFNNILQYETRTQSPNTYIWSYKNKFVVAEIKNITYAQLVGVLGQALIDRVASAAVPSDADMLIINALRNNMALKDALVTTYTYQPLVGMLTATDPSGITTYYDYDSFGRLKETYIYKDNIVSPANKQTVQKYEYNYKN